MHTDQNDSGIYTVFGQTHIGERHADQPNGNLGSDSSVLVSGCAWLAFYAIAIIAAVFHKAGPVVVASVH